MSALHTQLATDHPDFDLAMELLCTLPHENSTPANIKDLSEDLFGDRDKGSEVVALIAELRARTFLADTKITRVGNLVVVFINEFDWNKCRMYSNRYWKKVYG